MQYVYDVATLMESVYDLRDIRIQCKQKLTYQSLRYWFEEVVFLVTSPSSVYGQTGGTSVRQVFHLIRENASPT